MLHSCSIDFSHMLLLDLPSPPIRLLPQGFALAVAVALDILPHHYGRLSGEAFSGYLIWRSLFPLLVCLLAGFCRVCNLNFFCGLICCPTSKRAESCWLVSSQSLEQCITDAHQIIAEYNMTGSNIIYVCLCWGLGYIYMYIYIHTRTYTLKYVYERIALGKMEY